MNINVFEAGSSTALRYAQLKTKLSQIELPQQRQALLEATEPFGAQEFVGRGLLGFDSNQHWEAIRHLRSAVDKIPEDPQSYGVLAFLHVFLALAFWRDEEVVLEERFFQARRQYDQAFHYWDRIRNRSDVVALAGRNVHVLAGRTAGSGNRLQSESGKSRPVSKSELRACHRKFEDPGSPVQFRW